MKKINRFKKEFIFENNEIVGVRGICEIHKIDEGGTILLRELRESPKFKNEGIFYSSTKKIIFPDLLSYKKGGDDIIFDEGDIISIELKKMGKIKTENA